MQLTPWKEPSSDLGPFKASVSLLFFEGVDGSFDPFLWHHWYSIHVDKRLSPYLWQVPRLDIAMTLTRIVSSSRERSKIMTSFLRTHILPSLKVMNGKLQGVIENTESK